MERFRGAAAGLVFGILIAPIVGMVTYLLIFFIGILSLTRNAFFAQVQQVISLVGNGHPIAWAILTMTLTCMVSLCVGYACAWRFFSSPTRTT